MVGIVEGTVLEKGTDEPLEGVYAKFVQQFIDSSEALTSTNVYDPNKNAESYIEIKLSITKEDLRDYFIARDGNTDNAKFNTISLCYAYPVVSNDGKTYYNDIRPMTKLNIPSEPMADTTKGIDIIYHIYL